MKFTKLITENFQGLKGVQSFDLSEKYMVRLSKNGTGKTSLTNAIKYALTGAEPAGTMMTKGTARTSVTLFTDSGLALSREKTLSKGNRVYIDKKPTTQTAFNDLITDGIGMSTMKIVSSAELIAGLSPKELGNFLTSFIRTVERDEVFTAVNYDSMSTEYRTLLEQYFPNEKVTIAQIDALVKKETARRKELKKKLIEEQGALEFCKKKGLQTATRPREEIAADLESISRQHADASNRAQLVKQYEAARQARMQQDQQISLLQKELKEIGEISYSEEQKKALDEKQRLLTENSTSLRRNLALCEQTEASLTRAIDTINTPTCPLSDKLTCTTDKSSIISDLKRELDAAAMQKKELTKALEETEAEQMKLTGQLNALLNKQTAFDRKALLTQQLNVLQSSLTQIPPKPDAAPAEDTAAKLQQLQQELYAFDNYTQYVQIYQDFIKHREEWVISDQMVTLFAPTGVVKQALFRSFLDKFTEECNVRSRRFDGMQFHFFSDEKGIHTLIDVAGEGIYLDYHSLSGGEQAKALYILMTLFAEISGFRLLLLDELTILDTEGLATLLSLIREDEAKFDLIVLNAVDHADIKDVFTAAELLPKSA